ncbi:MAG: efflux RND transporter periplasmic adaptor subunit [Candidatus Acidiferrales bacterium]
MAKRMILMLAAVVVIVATLGFVKVRQIQSVEAFQPPPEAVTTIVAQQEKWPARLSVIGTMAAVQGVTVSADLPGVIDRIAFDSGHAIRQGDLLVQLDARQEQAQLAAAEAERDLARVNFARLEGLVSTGAISRANYDRAAAEQKLTEARVGEIRATIARKTIRAPFSGVLGIRQVNQGQYMSAGDAIVPLQSLNPIYVNFGIPQQDVGQVRVGRTILITSADWPGVEFTGRVTAINAVVDEATRNIQIQATLANPQGKLRPGMFVQVEARTGASRSVITLPASAISYAPYGDSVFVVSELKDQNGQAYRGVRQQFVKVDGARGDQVAVIEGIQPGDEVVTSGTFKLRNGAAVQINNQVQPENNRKPRPEDS